jgi:predicted ABC-type transport system involved in lysophospholipase L1 biosynthesis ATPase subunit
LNGLSAAENVSLPLELDGTPAKRANAIARAALEEIGLGERASRYPDELSGGENQRVAIARAVVGERRLLLADEPSTVTSWRLTKAQRMCDLRSLFHRVTECVTSKIASPMPSNAW